LEHEKYYQDYLDGKLDINAFLKFQLKTLAENDKTLLETWRKNYIEEKVRPVFLPKANELIEEHRRKGHELIIITATNRFITQPIADEFNIDTLIACEPELVDGQYTGRIEGTPSFAKGKVIRFHQWLAKLDKTPEEVWFYSDSHNDIPLLSVVDNPIAVDPDEKLKKVAQSKGWPVISLR
ncbi:HAD-IB family hydrolase, partial [Gammaproteobacteria bacterium]|nr:HAD-IB family hydrolase [Gammaproteobacteria bacterium]